MSIHEKYEKEIRSKIMEMHNLTSIEEVPRLEKIVVNMGIGRMRENKAFITEAYADLEKITGQKPSTRSAKTSISNFKLRKGQLAGYTVTLRRKKMWDFYEKLVTIVLPRVKDFRGVNEKAFDGTGNYNLGLNEHSPFPEIDANRITFNKPLQITIKTTAYNDTIAFSFLELLGMPFRKK